MKITPEEQAAIASVLDAGKRHGYGNMIAHLQTAWARVMMDRYGLDEEGARIATRGPGYPFQMQTDLVDRGEWDETGERYRKEQPCPAPGE